MGNIRIVGGSLGGRRLRVPKGVTRPTSERVREALASVLTSRDLVADARVLDLFTGSGALAFELLSRGAASAVMVDQDRQVLAVLEQNAKELHLSARVRSRRLDLLAAPRKVAESLGGEPFDLILADPPYKRIAEIGPLLSQLAADGLLTPEGTVIVEHAARDDAPQIGRLETTATYRYGDTALALYSSAAGDER